MAFHDCGFRSVACGGVGPVGVRQRHHCPGGEMEVALRLQAHGIGAQDGGKLKAETLAYCTRVREETICHVGFRFVFAKVKGNINLVGRHPPTAHLVVA